MATECNHILFSLDLIYAWNDRFKASKNLSDVWDVFSMFFACSTQFFVFLLILSPPHTQLRVHRLLNLPDYSSSTHTSLNVHYALICTTNLLFSSSFVCSNAFLPQDRQFSEGRDCTLWCVLQIGSAHQSFRLLVWLMLGWNFSIYNFQLLVIVERATYYEKQTHTRY